MTDPAKPKTMPNHEELHEFVSGLGRDAEEGVVWKHIFWTNAKASITLDENICQGRCELKHISEIPGYTDRIDNLISQLVKIKFFAIDFLRPMVLKAYGGVYMDGDYHFVRTMKDLHILMDLYTSFEGLSSPGINGGLLGVRKDHPAVADWLEYTLSYYGLVPDEFGIRDIIPMPAFRNCIAGTSDARAMSFVIWRNLNKYGNNDAVFKCSIGNDGEMCWRRQNTVTAFGKLEKADIYSRSELIKVGDNYMNIKQFGWQENKATWIVKETFTETLNGFGFYYTPEMNPIE